MKTLGRIVWTDDQQAVICLALNAAQRGGPVASAATLPSFTQSFTEAALLAHRDVFNETGRRIVDDVLARLAQPCHACEGEWLLPIDYETCPSCGRGEGGSR